MVTKDEESEFIMTPQLELISHRETHSCKGVMVHCHHGRDQHEKKKYFSQNFFFEPS